MSTSAVELREFWNTYTLFLTIGSTGSTYYADESQQKDLLIALAEEALNRDARYALQVAYDISISGKSFRQDAVLMVLACALRRPDVRTHVAVSAHMVARTFDFKTRLLNMYRERCNAAGVGMWNRVIRKMVRVWYGHTYDTLRDHASSFLGRLVPAIPLETVLFHVAKNPNANGWNQLSLFKLAHPAPLTVKHQRCYRAMLNLSIEEFETAEETPIDQAIGLMFLANSLRGLDKKSMPEEDHEDARRVLVDAILNEGATREMIPTSWINDPIVLSTLATTMPIGALVRNITRFQKAGFFNASEFTAYMMSRLTVEALQAGRIHPIQLAMAAMMYEKGIHEYEAPSFRWSTSEPVVAGTNDVFASFLRAQFVEMLRSAAPSGKRLMVCIDVSGSMSAQVAGSPLTAGEVASLLSYIYHMTEPRADIYAFATNSAGSNYSTCLLRELIDPPTEFSAYKHVISGLGATGTDLSMPMQFAASKHGAGDDAYDAFIVLTDNENYGSMKVGDALDRYNRKSGGNARLVVFSMTATQSTIVIEDDRRMLDVVGFNPTAFEAVYAYLEHQA